MRQPLLTKEVKNKKINYTREERENMGKTEYSVMYWWNDMGWVFEPYSIKPYLKFWSRIQYAWDFSSLVRSISQDQMTSDYWQSWGQLVSKLFLKILSTEFQNSGKGLDYPGLGLMQGNKSSSIFRLFMTSWFLVWWKLMIRIR